MDNNPTYCCNTCGSVQRRRLCLPFQMWFANTRASQCRSEIGTIGCSAADGVSLYLKEACALGSHRVGSIDFLENHCAYVLRGTADSGAPPRAVHQYILVHTRTCIRKVLQNSNTLGAPRAPNRPYIIQSAPKTVQYLVQVAHGAHTYERGA